MLIYPEIKFLPFFAGYIIFFYNFIGTYFIYSLIKTSTMENENQNQNIESNVIKEVSLPLFSSKGWIKLIGILMIIYGVFAALTLVGILVAWLPIWLGVLLMKVASAMEQARVTGNKELLIKAQNNLSTYFTIYGVLALIGIILAVVFIIVGLSTGLFMHMEDFGMNYY